MRPHRVLAPLDELILTVLSQNTSDINCERAYAAMRERYPRWQDVLAAPPAQLVAVLRPGGLANQKAPRIQAILAQLATSPAGLDLGWLAEQEPEAAMAFLTALPGVGREDRQLRAAVLAGHAGDAGGHAHPPDRAAAGADRPAGKRRAPRIRC